MAAELSRDELAVSYAMAILHDGGVEVTADKINALLKGANVEVEPYWPGLFVNLANARDLAEVVTGSGVGGGAAAEDKKASKEEAADKDGY
mmetsp:Transcript_14916/g.47552  ORF Transcript_14916/g.47552 Transcript_14916/m.47552 type:complete len:91 (-) Transcript_14916:113-385(-)|eukprot:CAMPEP_0196768794 /NCGR_PEP_ID=MMETSP1104-20130614/110_1 /TAXON_ID=33652 /ORGANISM="Cafeteria sp., Strain Caron Lab Isolate" /LENGTH=90 /DNA_ID=CAMNT_0042138867 /DNA_START=109 /DNA_END=381 /DNA_ORIENTATION=-